MTPVPPWELCSVASWLSGPRLDRGVQGAQEDEALRPASTVCAGTQTLW